MATKSRSLSKSSAAEKGPAALSESGAAPPARNKVAAADFFSALQRSLDAVQRQLSSANNAFADFVVKEFAIDAAVQLQTNDLGVLQLVLADDTMSAPSVSRLSVTLAAVAKASDEAPTKTMAVADATSLADLAWLPAQVAAQLAPYQIKTVSEFLGLVADARFSTQLTSMLKVKRDEIARWANQMRLLELPGMTVQCVGTLAEFGIRALAELSALNEKTIADLGKKTPQGFTTEMLTKWSEAARGVLGLTQLRDR